MKATLLFSILIILSFNLQAYDGSSLEIEVVKAYTFDEPISENFKGQLGEFASSNFIDDETSKGTLKFEVVKSKWHLNNAKNVAHYVWKHLMKATTVEPFPCGYYLDGRVDESGNDREYSMFGRGDGGQDSCTGSGGPGYWILNLTIKMNPNTLQGTIEYEMYSE